MNLLFVFLQAGGGGDYSFLIMMVAIKIDRNSIFANAASNQQQAK